MSPILYIIIPCYNEEEVLPLTSGMFLEELELLTLGSLRRAVQEGDVKNGTVMAGQIAGMINDVRPCADIIRGIMEEFRALAGTAAQYL